ncbi:MAG: iron-containing alcohol dehydrogenase family protein [Burkholderiales bacterium]
MTSFSHITPELRLHCGDDSLLQLARELDRHGCRRAVVFCGASVARPGQGLDALLAALGGRCADVFAGVRRHSPLPSVIDAAALLARVQADAVVALGGGSAIVTARAAGILQGEGQDVRALCTRRGEGGQLVSPRLLAPKLPQFVVPTTPTTACAKAGAAVHDPHTGERLALFDPKTRAKAIAVHPALLLAAPASLALNASLNTLAMAVEGLESAQSQPLSDALLMHALRLLAEHLPQLPARPQDAALRTQLVLAALLCGQGTDATGGGIASVLGHAIGPRSGLDNGLVNAMVLPYTLQFNAAATGERLHKVVQALAPLAPERDAVPAQAAIAAVQALLTTLSVPLRLREAGVPQAMLDEIAAEAMSDWFVHRNPRKVTGPADLRRVLDAAW